MFSITLTPIDFGSAGISSIVDSDSTINSVDENSPSGTTVGITASASDGAHAITYTLVDDDGGRFAINGSTGVVTLVGSLDRETDGASRNITVRATSAGGTFSERTFSIAVGDVNEFAVGPVTDTNASSNSVVELVAIGTVVGVTAAASDADATNSTITYSLTDDAGGKFAIDADTGVVTTAAAIDRETDGASLSITIRATSADGSFAEQSFAISISDVNEFAISAISDADASANEVAENSASGTTVGITAHATDADATDTVTYSLTYNDGGKFAIDGSTGVVTLVGTLDYETEGPTRTIVVRATSSDGSYSEQSFTINVLDVFDVSDTSPIQWALDGGSAYESSTLDSYQVLRSLESYGTYRKPRSGRCGLFDGTNDYATLGARLSAPGQTQFTASAWTKATGTSLMIIQGEYGPDYGFELAWLSGKFVCDAYGDSAGGTYKQIASASTYNDGAWHHVAVTFNAGTMAMYVDGAAVTVTTATSGTVTALPSSGAQVFRLGGGNATGYLNGSLRDARFYNVAKSAAEIAAIYNQASTPTTIDRTGLLGGWWLSEESGTTAYDWSGNGKHLTLTNITTSTFHAADTGVGYNPANHVGFGGGLFFDGTDDYATLGTRLFSGNPTKLTITAWIKTSSSNAVIAGESLHSFLFFLEAGSLKLRVSGDGTNDATAVAAWASTSWKHVACVYDGTAGTIKLYVDGVDQSASVSGVAVPASLYNTTAAFDIGRYNSGYYFGGSMRDVRVYSVAKSAAEIAAIKTGTADATGLLASYSGKRDLSGNGKNLALVNGAAELIIPRNEASTSNDAAGIALQYTGQCPHPALIETPCITGDGTAVQAALGAVGSASDFTAEVYYYHANSANRQRIIDVRNNAATYLWAIQANADNTGTPVSNQLFVQLVTSTALKIASALTVSNWHKITLARSGNTWTLTCSNLSTGYSATASTTDSAAFDAAAKCYLLGGYNSAGVDGTSLPCAGRLAMFSILQGGVTTYFPMQSGPGSSNTNRDLYYVRSDGTYSIISGAIQNGTVSTIWANRCPGYVQDWCANYGGTLNASGVFVPGQISGTLAADGSTKTLAAGAVDETHGSVVNTNPFSAPEMSRVYAPTANVPCLTGDGAGYVNLASITATLGDVDELEFWFYAASAITSAATGSPLIGTTGLATPAYIANYAGAAINETLLIADATGAGTSGMTYIKDTIPAGWNKVRYVWSSGLSRYRIYLNDVECTTYSGSTHAAKFSNSSIELLAYNNHSALTTSSYRLSSVKITTGASWIRFPLSDGLGSGSNRDIAWYKSDGTEGAIASGLTNGTPASLWANSTPARSAYSRRGNITRNTKFSHVDATSWAESKLITLASAASGTDLDNMEAYVA